MKFTNRPIKISTLTLTTMRKRKITSKIMTRIRERQILKSNVAKPFCYRKRSSESISDWCSNMRWLITPIPWEGCHIINQLPMGILISFLKRETHIIKLGNKEKCNQQWRKIWCIRSKKNSGSLMKKDKMSLLIKDNRDKRNRFKVCLYLQKVQRPKQKAHYFKCRSIASYQKV